MYNLVPRTLLCPLTCYVMLFVTFLTHIFLGEKPMLELTDGSRWFNNNDLRPVPYSSNVNAKVPFKPLRVQTKAHVTSEPEMGFIASQALKVTVQGNQISKCTVVLYFPLHNTLWYRKMKGYKLKIWGPTTAPAFKSKLYSSMWGQILWVREFQSWDLIQVWAHSE